MRGVGDRRGDRGSRENPDAGDRLQPPALRVRLVPGDYFDLERFDLRMQLKELCGQRLECDARKPRKLRRLRALAEDLRDQGTDASLKPCATMIPNSARCARNALASMVRCRTRSARVRWSISTAC